MKKLTLAILALVIFTVSAKAQVTFESIEVLQNLPSNLSCTNNSPLIKVASGPKAGFYQCLNGTLTAIGFTSGGNLSTPGLISAAGLSLNGTAGQNNYLANGMTSLPTGFIQNTLVQGAGSMGTTGYLGVGLYNTVIGYGAAGVAKSLGDTVAIGTRALGAWPGNGTGEEDGTFTCIGYVACGAFTTGGETVAIGHAALQSNPSGEFNTIAIGNHSDYVGGGSENVYLGTNITHGWSAGQFLQGSGNTFVGAEVMDSAKPGTTGTFASSNLTMLGYGAGGCMMGSTNNIGIGVGVYDFNIGNSGNVCPTTLPTATQNFIAMPGFVGANFGSTGPGGALTTGSYNLVLTMPGQTTPYGIGGAGLTTGSFNIFFGAGAGATASTASDAIAIGQEAGNANNASDNVFIGGFAGKSSTSVGVVAIGHNACSSLTTGSSDVCIGEGSTIATSNDNSVAIGWAANAGTQSVVLGRAASDGGGQNNIVIGFNASCAQNFNTLIGSTATCTNNPAHGIAIGVGATIGASNSTVFADGAGGGTNSTAKTFQWDSLPLGSLATFSVTGCGTAGSLTGSGLAGTFTAGSTTCAPVITTGVTAPNGFVCRADDWTTPADALHQVSATTTTATFASATVVLNDKIGFTCAAY